MASEVLPHVEFEMDPVQNTGPQVKEGDEIRMLVDKCGMLAGTRARIITRNSTQWKLDNRKSIQRNQRGEAWELVVQP